MILPRERCSTSCLAFEAEEPRHLNTTEYDAYIVNDSTIRCFSPTTRSDSDKGWTLRFAEAIELAH